MKRPKKLKIIKALLPGEVEVNNENWQLVLCANCGQCCRNCDMIPVPDAPKKIEELNRIIKIDQERILDEWVETSKDKVTHHVRGKDNIPYTIDSKYNISLKNYRCLFSYKKDGCYFCLIHPSKAYPKACEKYECDWFLKVKNWRKTGKADKKDERRLSCQELFEGIIKGIKLREGLMAAEMDNQHLMSKKTRFEVMYKKKENVPSLFELITKNNISQ